jgi:DNA-binding transcriptional LysR family regulator
MVNLRGVDLNLLPVFEAAYEERNLSRAARRLAMTQSAVSHSMTRLRTVFRDELFIRKTNGVEPTRVADLIYGRLRGAMGAVRDAVSETRVFDPATSERSFFIGISHPLGPMIAVRLRERLARAAPNVAVAFSTRSRPLEMERGLREGWVDAVVDWLPFGRGRYQELVLFEDSIVAVARTGHPALRRPLSLSELKKASFVNLRPRIPGDPHPVPGILEWRRLELNVVLEVSEFLEVFMVASRSDLFGLIPSSMVKFGGECFGLKPLKAGPKVTVPIRLIWPIVRERDAAHEFLRKQIQLATNDVVPRRRR